VAQAAGAAIAEAQATVAALTGPAGPAAVANAAVPANVSGSPIGFHGLAPANPPGSASNTMTLLVLGMAAWASLVVQRLARRRAAA